MRHEKGRRKESASWFQRYGDSIVDGTINVADAYFTINSHLTVRWIDDFGCCARKGTSSPILLMTAPVAVAVASFEHFHEKTGDALFQGGLVRQVCARRRQRKWSAERRRRVSSLENGERSD